MLGHCAVRYTGVSTVICRVSELDTRLGRHAGHLQGVHRGPSASCPFASICQKCFYESCVQRMVPRAGCVAGAARCRKCPRHSVPAVAVTAATGMRSAQQLHSQGKRVVVSLLLGVVASRGHSQLMQNFDVTSAVHLSLAGVPHHPRRTPTRTIATHTSCAGVWTDLLCWCAAAACTKCT